ncbi:MAG TPA: autotransporter outer membrane beta-barrel domain-containing protein [Flavobacterium sp.]|nr:autotransporter outer membrane beta-barrel domain-containing protein [Flavobacterium sp.]
MKKSLLLFLFLCSAGAAVAQTDSTEVRRYNFLKVNLSSVVFNNYSFQYERVLSKRWSVALGYRFMPSSNIPFKSNVDSFVDETDDATQFLIDNAKISNTAITPEVRLYLGKGYGRGFYLAPYYRYSKFKAETVKVEYTDENGDDQVVTMGGDITGNSFGLMLGAQWTIGSHFVIDWWIIGGHIGSGSGKIEGTTSQLLDPAEQAQVRDVIEEFDLPFIDEEVEVTPNGASVKMDGGWGGIRAFGLSVGYRF